MGNYPTPMHAFDRQLARRCLAIGLVLTLLATGLIVATDEAGSTLSLRAARLAAVIPAIVVVAQRIAIGQSEARGEARALWALGSSPWRVVLGATVAGWLLGAVSLAILASPLSDVRSLFPTVPTPAAWVAQGEILVDPVHGASVARDGSIRLDAEVDVPAARGAPGRAAALACFAPLAAVVPVWSATNIGLAARLSGAGLGVAAAITLLHAVAQGRLGPQWLMLASVPLVLQGAFALLRRRTT